MNKFIINVIREDNKNLYFEIEKPTPELLKYLENKDFVNVEILDSELSG